MKCKSTMELQLYITKWIQCNKIKVSEAQPSLGIFILVWLYPAQGRELCLMLAPGSTTALPFLKPREVREAASKFSCSNAKKMKPTFLTQISPTLADSKKKKNKLFFNHFCPHFVI